MRKRKRPKEPLEGDEAAGVPIELWAIAALVLLAWLGLFYWFA